MKINTCQYSLMSFAVLIALSGTTHAATTYMEARNDAMGGTGVASSHLKRGELFKIDLQLIQDNQKRHNGELFKIKFAVV